MVPPERGPRPACRPVAALLVTLLVASRSAGADELSPTLEQLELEHSIDKATRAFDKQTLPIEAISADFLYRCLRATGAAELCDCLVEERPYSLRFEQYVRITSRTKAELGYERLSADGRQLVDKVHRARETCVGPERRAPDG